MSGPQILISESAGFPADAVTLLEQSGTVHLADLDREGLCLEAPKADVVWVRLRHRIDEPLLRNARRLRAVVTPTTGLNHIDMDALTRRGIHLISLRGEIEFLKNVRATAEHTIGLMLAATRHVPAAAMDVQQGNWNRDAFQGHELYGKTIGIVGFGRLGRIVARYLEPFDTRILVTDPKVTPGPITKSITAMAMEQLLAESDLVTIHVDLRQDTNGFFSASAFDKMKWGSYFINTARGELIDEQALLANLRTGRIAGAALDVLCNEDSEGMASHPLVQYARSHTNLLITPHLGGCTVESMQKAEVFLAQKLFRFIHEGSLAGVASASL